MEEIMRIVKNNPSNFSVPAHKVLDITRPKLRIVKPRRISLSMEYIIGEDVEDFKNVEDFLLSNETGEDVVAMLTH
jgi:tRNA A-37 threonylcarbamoyl transferase component Bud32